MMRLKEEAKLVPEVEVEVHKFIGITNTYDELRDFVHPNFGNNKLVSSGTLGTGSLFASATVFEAELAEANRVTEALSVEVFEF